MATPRQNRRGDARRGTLDINEVTGGPLDSTGGGTGLTSYTKGDLLTADTTASLSQLNAVSTGQVLLSAGTGALPVYGQVELGTTDTAHVTGLLPPANGGAILYSFYNLGGL